MANTDLFEYYKKGKYPSHVRATAAVLIVFSLFIAVGIYSLMDLWNKYGGPIMAFIQSLSLPTWVTSNLWMIFLILGALVTFSMFMAVGASYIAKRLGGGLIYIGALFMNLVTWSIVGFSLWSTDFNFNLLLTSWPLMLPGMFTLFVTLLLFTVFRNRVRRAGQIISLTGQVCLDEKGVFVPPLLTMVFTLVSALLFAGIVMYFTPIDVILGIDPWTIDSAIPVTVGVVLYLFTTIFFYNLAYATSSAVAYIYIRGRDPSLRDGIRASKGVIGGLAALAVASVLVSILRIILQRLGRQVGGAGGAVVGKAAGDVIGWVWALINYFTIPAMVCEQAGVKDSIKRSANLVRKHFVDVIIKETAVRWGFSVIAVSFFIAFLLGGAVLGWLLSAGDIFMTIVMAVVFLIFAALPSSLVLRTFDIVYVTLLYVFIRTQEGQITGKTAIPGELEYELQTVYRDAKKSS